MTKMAKILTEEQYRERFHQILEYTQALGVNNSTVMNEADPNEPQQGPAPDPTAAGGDMGADPMGAEQNPMGGNNMNGAAPDPTAAGGDMGTDPMGGEQGAEGFNPQGGEDAMPMDDMGMEDDDMDDIEEMEEGDEVIDIDALTGYQKRTAKGVGKVSDEIKDLKRLIMQFQEKVEANNQGLEALQQELVKRAPNAEEKMSLRKQKSGPFNQSIEEYWGNHAPENYSIEDDENGENNPKYQITKNDIDGVSNWNEIAKTFDDMAEINSLKNIFGF